MIVVAAVLAFAAAALLGERLGTRLCRGRSPFEDGPRPRTVAPWIYPVAGGVLGVIASTRAIGTADVTSAALAIIALALIALAACVAADLRCGVLPDLVTVIPLFLVLAVAAIRHDPVPLAGALIAAIPFALAASLSRGTSMGWGDVKLAALGGALLGARDAVIAFIAASAVMYAIAFARKRLREPTAFGPYLASAVALALAVDAQFF